MEIKVFEHEKFGAVRTMTIDGQPYFVGKDVADILGYRNSRDALNKHVEDEDKKSVAIRDGIPGNPNQVVINESGVYSLILSSHLPTAKQFKHWVTSEVLPSIRRYGLYAAEDLLADPDTIIAILQALKSERETNKVLTEKVAAQAQQVAIQAQQIAELQPKAGYYDVVLACPDLVPISQISKDYGWSAMRLNQWLYEHGIQFKQGKIWLLYQKYAEYGYTSTKTCVVIESDRPHTKVHTYWTQKGRLFIYHQLKSAGILPLIERGQGR